MSFCGTSLAYWFPSVQECTASMLNNICSLVARLQCPCFAIRGSCEYFGMTLLFTVHFLSVATGIFSMVLKAVGVKLRFGAVVHCSTP